MTMFIVFVVYRGKSFWFPDKPIEEESYMINSWPDNTSFGRLASLNVNRGGKRVESRRRDWGR